MPRRNLLVLLTLIFLALICQQPALKNPYRRALAAAMTLIESRSLRPTEETELFAAAIDGMLSRLDENSVYVTPDEVEAFEEELNLQFGGIGVQVAVDPQSKQLIVLSPLAGSPAYRAGVLAGDKIIRIGKKDTKGMSIEEAHALLRGNPGEAVTLTVVHEGQQETQEVTITREVIQGESVLGDRRKADGSWTFTLEGHPGVGYVRIRTFTEETPAELERVLESLSKQGMRGLVLDLRDDPGGYVDAAVEIARLFIEPGTIVTMRGRYGVVHRAYTANTAGPYSKLPIAVLVNQHSASAAEIVAACLQDHKRAVVVGQRSYGKGTVQEIIDLGADCGEMKLTTFSYWRPNGQDIQRPADGESKADWGVSPNEGYKVELTSEEFARWQLWRAHRDFFHGGMVLAKTPAETKSPVGKTPLKPTASEKGEAALGPPASFTDRPLQKAVEYVERVVVEK